MKRLPGPGWRKTKHPRPFGDEPVAVKGEIESGSWEAARARSAHSDLGAINERP